MNSVLFGLLLAVCAFQVSNADLTSGIRNNINAAISQLDSISNDMSRTSTNTDFTYRGQISNKKTDYMSQINGFVNPAISQIRADVDAAKAEGKDAEHCHTTAMNSLRATSQSGFYSLDLCETDAKNLLQQALSGLATHQATAENLKSQVNRIMPACYSPNQMQMVTCATTKLSLLQFDIRTLQNNANTAKFTVGSSANNAVLSITNCGMRAMNPVRTETANAKITASNCLKNV